MSDTRKINPSQPAGVRDYYGQNMIARQKMIDTIRETFERFGFDPQDTPILERMEVLTGGESNPSMRIFEAMVMGSKIKTELSSRIGMRFDLTVPLARVVAGNSDIPRPYLRYQYGKVLRGETPQAGRYREFAQFDIDIVGSSLTQSDVHVCLCIYETLKALGVDEFVIHINNRKILNALPIFASFDPKLLVNVLRTIDKLDKLSEEDVAGELQAIEGVSSESVDKILEFTRFESSDWKQVLNLLEEHISQLSDEGREGVEEIREIADSLIGAGVPDTFWRLTPRIARGLSYYTGPIFEAVVTGSENFGSVFSGGRYDGLVKRFSSDSVSATGASIGVDRLFAVLESKNKISARKTLSQVLILMLDSDLVAYYNGILARLRRIGVKASLYLGKEKSVKGQLSYALNQEIPFVMFIGSREVENNELTIKNLESRKQEKVPNDQLEEFFQKALNL